MTTPREVLRTFDEPLDRIAKAAEIAWAAVVAARRYTKADFVLADDQEGNHG